MSGGIVTTDGNLDTLRWKGVFTTCASSFSFAVPSIMMDRQAIDTNQPANTLIIERAYPSRRSMEVLERSLWSYDSLCRRTNETLVGTAPTGTISHRLDAVGNRTNRTSGVASIVTTNNYFDANDWLDIDSTTNNSSAWFDGNGNTRTNGATTYLYDWANRLTNSSTVTSITYDGDGNRVKKWQEE